LLYLHKYTSWLGSHGCPCFIVLNSIASFICLSFHFLSGFCLLSVCKGQLSLVITSSSSRGRSTGFSLSSSSRGRSTGFSLSISVYHRDFFFPFIPHKSCPSNTNLVKFTDMSPP